MTHDEQRIVIAEAVGWTHLDICCGIPRGKSPEPSGFSHFPIVELPNYPGDMNAAIELCHFLAKQGWRCNLNMGTDGTWECEFHHSEKPFLYAYAPNDKLPLAICESFLRAIGLWKDEVRE